jgi:hypothetical protein
MQERECGRPTLGSSEWGEHPSTATDAGSAGRAAKQWNRNSASLSLKKKWKKERKESEGSEMPPRLIIDLKNS